ncbi:methyltransferase [Ferrimonas balearica]|uniref:methyltransferase n=1 Tax=Ferrimonas balearica TaxID=44012 RepID=UPI001C99006C|nr:methyltransferase [Ferrimonas balearica]MBY5991632.1 SAM-dependent methyltransferase [Ferrimonas balearica]
MEWCAGKGHLGRLVALTGQARVTSLEWDPTLCQEGERLAQRAHAKQRFVCADALGPEATGLLTPKLHAIALHACGDLHRRLLEHAVLSQSQGLTLSPCCYHLTEAKHYQALSQQGQRQALALSRDELRIAVQETATAPQRVRRLRGLEMAYRLGLRTLIRERWPTRVNEGIPSCPKAQLSDGFETFCRWAMARKGFVLEVVPDWAALEASGWQQWHQLRRFSLLRGLFARPVELYLVLDRVRFLEEQGYRVRLSRFTERGVTPRNLLIQAERI